MRVGWLADDPGYLGGAELTQAEFHSAASEGVEIVNCPPGGVVGGLDRYVVHNCMTYDHDEMPRRCIRYHHDTMVAPADPAMDATHIFCSPLQQERMGMAGECIPPTLDLAYFEAVANQNHRHGAVCIGRMAYGKGLERLDEYSEPVDVYSSVPVSSSKNVRYRGVAEDVAKVLSRYETFVHLPTVIEPFGRAVVEAWAAGLRLVLNKNVGARYWIEENPEGLRTAGNDFWDIVLNG